MRHDLKKQILSYKKEHQRNKRRTCIISGLSLIVAFVTVLWLTVPAITLETICGYEEHIHGSECYSDIEVPGERSIICDVDNNAEIILHTHDEYCYNADGSLLCTLTELTEHHHGEGCYSESRALICELEENEGHRHLESCYADARDAICGYTESQTGHIHTEACFEDPRTPICGQDHQHKESCFENPRDLICGLAEGEGAHTHNEDCFTIQSILVCELPEIFPHTHSAECADGSCGLPEVIAHQHTVDCIQEGDPTSGRVLTCQIPEHQHSDECYPDEGTNCGMKEHAHSSDCYNEAGEMICEKTEHEHTDECTTQPDETTEDDQPSEIVPGENESYIPDPYSRYESVDYIDTALANVLLTGRWSEDVLAVAKSQLGYRESKTDYVLDEKGIRKGYTYYGDWYGIPYGDWCAMFVSFCLDTAEVKDYPLSAGCQTWIEKLSAEDIDLWHPAVDPVSGERYIPRPGDLIFYDFDLDGQSDHVGLVSELIDESENTPALIKTVEGNYADMVCIVTHAQNYEGIMGYGELPENPDFIEPEEQEIRLSCETETGFLVTVNGPASSFPAEAGNLTLRAREILKEAATEDELMAFEHLDAFMSSSESHGSRNIHLFDITLYVDGQAAQLAGPVSVSFLGIEDSEIRAYHISSESVVSLEVYKTEDGETTFETEHFSWFALVTDDLLEVQLQPMLSLRNTSSSTASLTVRKIWVDGGNTRPASITVTLYDNNGSTGQTLTLSAADNWMGTFTGLSIPAAGQDFEYYVVETPVSDYFTSYGEVNPVQTVTEEAYWVPVSSNQISDGGTYAFCTSYGGAYYTLGSDLGANTNYLPALSVTVNGPITINGVTYPNYLTGVDVSAAFLATQSGQGYILQNTYTGKYLTAYGYCSPTFVSGSANYLLNILNGGYLGAYNGSRYIRQASANGSGNHDFSNSTSTSGASTFQIYERVQVTTTENSYETSITNTYINPNPGGGSGSPDGPEIHKTIDYLGDGVTNPDTSLSGNEYYRLYLDVTAAANAAQPVDLLLILDNSGSMFTNTQDALIDGRLRNDVLLEVLWYLIPDFLNANPGNRISLVYFSGPASIYTYAFSVPTNVTTGNVADDAWVAQDWTQSINAARGSLMTSCRFVVQDSGGGTNYAQAFTTARSQIDSSLASGHTPYVLFLSDGVPTYYVQSNGLRGGNGYDPLGRSIMSSFYTVATRNVENCFQPTLNSIAAFKAAYPDITISAVGFSSTIQSTHVNIMTQMPHNGGFYQHATDTASLREALTKAVDVAVSGVTVTDKLSSYVQIPTAAGAQADYKVTMRNIATGMETVLYQNGSITQAGTGILNSVVYAPSSDPSSTGTVKLNFVPSYELNSDYVYTLSFNVELTQEAYDTYNNAGQQYPHTGDPNTDYVRTSDNVGNETSSNEPGLYSNSIAYVDYTIGGSSYMDFYPHPVVQVTSQTTELTVRKQVINGPLTNTFTFEIVFRDSSNQVITNIPAGQGYTVDAVSGKVSFTLTHGQSVTISGLPIGATATITETGHAGYVVLIKEGNQTLFTADSGTITLNSDREILFVNSAGAVLPETGGTGAIPYTLGGITIMITAFMCGCRWRRRGRRATG